MKRIIGFSLFGVVCIIFAAQRSFNEDYLSIIVLPLTWIGDVLRMMSTEGGFLNLLAMFLFIVIGVSPLLYLGFKWYKKTVQTPDYILLPLITITLMSVVYYFINPHLIVMKLNQDVLQFLDTTVLLQLESILLIGLGSILYTVIIIYIVSTLFVNKHFDSIKLFTLLLNIVIVISIFGLLYVSLGSLIQNYGTSSSFIKTNLLLDFLGKTIVMGLFIYLLELFKIFIIKVTENGFQQELLVILQKLYVYSFILLITSLVSQLIINLHQFVILHELTNISLQFDIPLVTILIVSIIFIISNYFKKVIELKQDHEMII